MPATTVSARRRCGVHDAAVCCSTPSTPFAHRRPAPRTSPRLRPVARAHRRQHGRHRRELAEPGAHLVDDVRARRAEPSTARARVEPPVRHRAAGSATSGTYCTSVNVRGSPIRPSAIARATSARSGAQRNSWPTRCVTPRRRRRRRASPPPRPRRARTASRRSRAGPPRTLRSRARRACRAGWRSSPRRRPASASASLSSVHACGDAERARRGGACARGRARRARPRRSRRCADAGTWTRHPNPVPTTTAPGTGGQYPSSASTTCSSGSPRWNRPMFSTKISTAACLQLRRVPRDVRGQPHLRVRVHPVAGRQRLGVDGVERRHRDRAVVERDAQRVLVDERAPRDVDEVHARLHQRERVGIEQCARALRSPARRARRGRRRAASSSSGAHDLDARAPGSARRCAASPARACRTPARGVAIALADAAEADEGEGRALDAIERRDRKVPVLRRLGQERLRASASPTRGSRPAPTRRSAPRSRRAHT